MLNAEQLPGILNVEAGLKQMGVKQGNISKALLKHRQIPSSYLRKQTHSAWGGMHFKQVGPKFCLPSI